ncbi:MAG: hypothetical protein BZY75_01635 [SAR202 cluster bacterium Io17-Chloro-G7]|nr:MAG: hypothetical protein BZY75_01635 [SAR202 cluster bacterium Io17-Chloro-G7]
MKCRLLGERRFLITRGIFALTALATILAIACGAVATAKPIPTIAPITVLTRPSEGEIVPIMATTQLRIGTQRVSFLLTTSQSLIKAPEATVSSTYQGEGQARGESKRAEFHLWPYGVRGAYSTEMTFEKAGLWNLEIDVIGPDGPVQGKISVDVLERVTVPEIGSIPPLSLNKTVHSVSSLGELTTDFTPDPDLYQLTIGDAIITGRPTVIVFATPAFCTSPTCGPQVDTVSELKERHVGEANFIHVELYDNPHEIQGDLTKAVFHPLVDAWGLSKIPHWFNESWTFVLGADGRIAHKFEGFATLDELDEALTEALTGL